jgi:UDP-N-acetylmuramoyl-tripeptide--D-alanyl-D-alanine ligase
MKQIARNVVLSYFRFLAGKALKLHKPTVIGIAGSVGKSSTRNALEAILKDHFPIKSVGNSETGIPLGILGMTPKDYTRHDWLNMAIKAPLRVNYLKGTKYLIAEMGIDEPDPPKNMEYLLKIIKPDIAIVLNESVTHSQQFDKTVTDTSLSPEARLKEVVKNIAREDAKIITKSHCDIAVYNADDMNISESLRRIRNTKLFTFGSSSTNDIYYGDYSVNLEGTVFNLHMKEEGNIKILLTFKDLILPKEYEQVFASAILATKQTGLSLDQIKESLVKNFILPKGRSSLLKGIKGSVIIDSSYNASKASAIAFLDLVYMLKRITKRPVVLLLGDMRELGKEAKQEHEDVAEKTVGIVDYMYCVGPLTREYVLPVVQKHEDHFKEIRWFDKSPRAGEFLKENLPKDALVLVKGSQNTIFLEEAIKYILADKKDEQKLCRQDSFWMSQKKLATSR